MSKPWWRPFALGLALIAPVLGGCDEKVAGSLDRVPPTVAVTSPAADSPVSGVGFFVEVEATDDVGVERVEVSVDGGTPVVLAAPPYRAHVVTLGGAVGSPLSLRAEAFDQAGNSDGQTVSVNIAARTLTKLTADPQDDMYPAWSPDGARIAFQSDRGSGELNLWVMDTDGGNPSQLTTNVNEDRHPAWSPDGAWIAFDSDRAGTFDIWILPLATGEADAVNLTFGNDDDIEPAWNPEGTEIWFASSRGTEADFDIWRQDVATGTAIQITSFVEDDRAPALSPDGAALAFASSLGFSTPHVYTRSVDATDVTPLTGDVGLTESDPAWAPAGRVVTFTRSAGTSGTLWFKPVDPDVPVAQVSFGTGTVGDGGAAWHPDGDRVAFHSDRDGNLDIWLLK